MATFILFGNYTASSIQEISAQRTAKAKAIIKRYRGKLKAMYAALGAYDLVVVVDFPGIEEAMKTSIAFTRSLGIAIHTAPAIPVSKFDQMVRKV